MAAAGTAQRSRKKRTRNTAGGKEDKGNAHSREASLRGEKKRVGEHRFDGQQPGRRTRHKGPAYTGKT